MNQDEFSYIKNCFCRLRGALKAVAAIRHKFPRAIPVTQKQNDELVELDNEIDELLHKIYGQQMVYDKQ